MAQRNKRRELLKGTLELVILGVLHDKECHAYSLRKRLVEMEGGVFAVGEGTLYGGLHRLEDQGLIRGQGKEGEKGPRQRVYTITDRGRGDLQRQRTQWLSMNKIVTGLIPARA